MIGICYGLPAGTYTVQVYVGPPGYAVDVITGDGGYWLLEAEEVK